MWTIAPVVSYAADLDKVAQDATSAVVSVDGYMDFPVYTLDLVESGPNFITYEAHETGSESRRVTAGSGFFVTPDGYVMTNRHVVDDPDLTYEVNTGSERLVATVVYMDPDYDLAILKVPGDDFSAITIADYGVTIGDEVAAVGNAFGRSHDTLYSGKVTALGETVVASDRTGVERLEGLIATDASLHPGDSGGPLLDKDGQAVGVNVAINIDGSESFSIPGSVVRLVLKRSDVL
jgi:Trypsin-like serine proteases, typically periplasmic, contain C-terminal PDZ domain